MRKLIALTLVGAGIAAVLKKRAEATTSSPEPAQPAPSDLAEARPAQTDDTIAKPVAGAGDEQQSVIPDVSSEDTVVREQEEAARTEAGSIGGTPDSATADTDPSMRPVQEGSGDDPETFEATEEQGR